MMPNREIRSDALTSARVNQLDQATENFWWRLLLVTDDYGRFYASPAHLRVALYPQQPDRLSDQDAASMLDTCESLGLVQKYAVDGVRYFFIPRFGQRARTKPRFPEPPEGTAQAAEPRPPTPPKPALVPKPAPAAVAGAKGISVTVGELIADGLPDTMATEYLAHRKARKALLTHTAWDGIKREASKAGWSIADACAKAMERGWTGFDAVWLDKEANRRNASAETAYHRERRERMEEFVRPRPMATPLVEEITDAVPKSN